MRAVISRKSNLKWTLLTDNFPRVIMDGGSLKTSSIRRTLALPEIAVRADPLYRMALAHYAQLRKVAFNHAVERAIARGIATPATTITPISRQTIQAYSASWAGLPHWTGSGGWPWDVITKPFLKKPRAFHAALWEDDTLCGMADGSVSRGKERITLRFMQSSPQVSHPLRGRVALLMFEAATAYGEVLGSRHLILRNPLEGALPIYRRLGFEIAQVRQGMLYLSRKLV